MNRSLEPLLPALDNPMVFAVVVVLLLALVTASAVARFARPSDALVSGQLVLARRATAIATWILLTFWLAVGAGLVAFAGAVGGSLLIVVIGILTFLIAFPLLTTWLVAWSRGRVWADWLTLLLVVGLSTTVMTIQRLWICEPLAWGGFGPAQVCTARLYAEGSQGAIRDTGVAASWYGQAALSGSEEAVRGLMSVTRNKLTQRRHLEKAALAGNAAAMYHLSVLLGPPEGLPWLNMAVERRQADALYQKSRYLRTGEHGFDRDVELANTMLKGAAWRDSTAAAADLALAYAAGDRPFGYSRLRSWFWEMRVDDQWSGYGRWLPRLEHHRRIRDGIRRRDAAAMLELARYYQSKARKDPAYEADVREWLTQAAEAGSVEAQFEMAFIHFRRDDATDDDRADARRWLTAAADKQHRYALSNTSYFLTKGLHGFQIDLELARDYARTLVALLSSERRPHQRDLELARTRLDQLEKQLEKQLAWEDGLDDLQVRASAGEADALYKLYEKHVGDRERGEWELAQSLLLAAAEQGHIEARYRIASRTLSQPRTPDEEARAYEWMQDTAARGHRGALVTMGRIHLRGLPKYGIEKDPYSARELLERALAGLEGDVVYARRNGTRTVATKRESVERLIAGIETIPALP